MSIGIGSDSLYSARAGAVANNTKTDQLQAKLKNKTASDEELMEACKDFEAYLLEQVFKGMEKTVLKDEEDENEYMAQFGDTLYEEYAKSAAESSNLGIAQMLYDSMKRNS